MKTSIFTRDGKFLMLANDHRDSLKKLLSPNDHEKVSTKDLVEFKKDIIDQVISEVSGLLIDVEYGLLAYEKKSKPFLLPIEKSGFIKEGVDRVTELEHTVEDLKKLGAAGIKLLIHYDQDSSTVNVQMETAKKVLNDCRDQKLPLFLEILTYGAGSKPDQIVGAVNMMLDQDIRPDVFKLEFPDEEKYCRVITDSLDETPWILLTRGKTYDLFKEELKTAMSAGASGFLAGRSLWEEASVMKGEERLNFLQTIYPQRFREISQIALG